MKQNGMTMVEIAITLAIVAILTSVFVITVAGSRTGDQIDRGAQLIYDDLIFIRSRAVSTNTTHRIRFASTTEWVIDMATGNPPPNDWQTVTDVRRMPTDTNLTDVTFLNAAGKLHATSRGLFDFTNGCVGVPYVTIEALGFSKTRSINVAVGGALDFETN